MTDFAEVVSERLRRKNKVLFRADDPFLSDLKARLGEQDGKTVVLWAFGFAEEIAAVLAHRYPREDRPAAALFAAKNWALGKIKMARAQRAILDCHAFAKEISSPEDIALCHALGQACSTVHTAGHAMGLPVYELTALVHRVGVQNCADTLMRRVREYTERLLSVRAGAETEMYEWAEFLRRRI